MCLVNILEIIMYKYLEDFKKRTLNVCKYELFYVKCAVLGRNTVILYKTSPPYSYVYIDKNWTNKITLKN